MASHRETFCPPKTVRDFSLGDEKDGHGLLAETDALPRAHICLEEWMERSDGETLASFKSHAW